MEDTLACETKESNTAAKPAAVISYYHSVKDPGGGCDMLLADFLAHIKNGKWRDIVTEVREQKKQKNDAPAVTVSGTFANRSISGLKQHSGYLCLDFDKKDNPQFAGASEMKAAVCRDKHVYAAAVSISGNGVFALIKIIPAKHAEAFEHSRQYWREQYGMNIDPQCRDVARSRFVSYDPALFMNEDAAPFLPHKKDAPEKIPGIVYVQDDFENAIAEVQRKNINICESYDKWLRAGFALADKFGEGGRRYFHSLSCMSAKYHPGDCDRQYTYCLEHRAASGKVTIATLYHYFKQAGISVNSARTRLIINTAVQGKRDGKDKQSIAENLEQTAHVAPQQCEDIINQVFESDVEADEDHSQFAVIKRWLKCNYNFRRNRLTHYIDHDDKPMEEEDFNSVYCRIKELYEKVRHNDLLKIIHSDFVPDYNPLINFLEENKHRDCEGTIQRLWECIRTDNPRYLEHFGTRWLVGMIASIFGQHSPLMLVFTGAQNVGKSYFFSHLLPEELQQYFALIKWDKGKDDEITLTRKLLLLDDEMEAHSKKTEAQIKAILSTQNFFVRLPYGKASKDLPRLAVLCGTSNPDEVLSDPTGNRRIIPVKVFEIAHRLFNEVDKTSLLIEAYRLYQKGFRWMLTKEDIARLNAETAQFENYSVEYELLSKHFKVPERDCPRTEELSATDIKVELEGLTRQVLSKDRIGKEMKRIGFEQELKRKGGDIKRIWKIERAIYVTP